jgi:uncharacterized protein (DUF2062 family)
MDEEEPVDVRTVVIVDDVSVSYHGVSIWPPSIPAMLVGSILAASLAALLLILFTGRRRTP